MLNLVNRWPNFDQTIIFHWPFSKMSLTKLPNKFSQWNHENAGGTKKQNKNTKLQKTRELNSDTIHIFAKLNLRQQQIWHVGLWKVRVRDCYAAAKRTLNPGELIALNTKQTHSQGQALVQDFRIFGHPKYYERKLNHAKLKCWALDPHPDSKSFSDPTAQTLTLNS